MPTVVKFTEAIQKVIHFMHKVIHRKRAGSGISGGVRVYKNRFSSFIMET